MHGGGVAASARASGRSTKSLGMHWRVISHGPNSDKGGAKRTGTGIGQCARRAISDRVRARRHIGGFEEPELALPGILNQIEETLLVVLEAAGLSQTPSACCINGLNSRKRAAS